MLRTRQTPGNHRPPERLPLPTVAQCAYGALTVVFSTLAMLLLSQTTSGAWIAVIACAALGLGLLVAMTVPMPRTARAADGSDTGAVPHPPTAPSEPRQALPVPGPRERSSVGGHSLRG
ncbi:hypothetical protein ACFYVL_22620 [Streptomyces sp. NPDC004111]|uniref:hypothetical protein n=1 Tax=Streptomyces sp. NPDC004111 TaxID=3364690 RepID=UPI0036A43846